ncbi:MAG: hypothetical protein IIC06_01285 [Proteobacteria bacterium]|nr:hypothetical protein [Pseudomonadota bacterium]MCH8236785.1 hypothetical protein [Pseudomonadota bacterium]
MVHFVRGADLLYFALLHQGDAVAYAHRLDLVVGNQNGGAAGFPLAAYFFYLVTTMGRRAQLIDNVGGLSQEQQVMIGPYDRLFVASFSNSTSEVVHTAEQTLR